MEADRVEFRQPAPAPSVLKAAEPDLISLAKAELEKVLKSKAARQKLRNATAQITALKGDEKEEGK